MYLVHTPDSLGLKEYFNSSDSDGLKKIFFVHGEKESMYDLKENLDSTLSNKVEIPFRGQDWEL